MRNNIVILFLILLPNFSFGQKSECKIYPVDESRNDYLMKILLQVLVEPFMENKDLLNTGTLKIQIVQSYGN